MSRHPNKVKNVFNEAIKDGVICIEFITGGKNKVSVKVDKESWDEYLCNFHWTAQKNGRYFTVVTSSGGIPVQLSRMILEKEYLEIDHFGYSVDHKNNDPLDNRKINLRLVHHLINLNNQKSKYKKDNMHNIYPQGNSGYKVDTNTAGKKTYKNFKTKEDAIEYRDQYVLPAREAENIRLVKKIRDTEFERGLKHKLQAEETDEILKILRANGFICSYEGEKQADPA